MAAVASLKLMSYPNKPHGRDIVDNKLKQDTFMAESPRTPQSPSANNLCVEENRLKTFMNWSVTFINKKKLAQFGFYYIGPDDLVKCYFCRVEIGMWEPGDNVLSEHMRWSPYCPLLRRRDTDNVPIDSNFPSLLPPQSFDTCGFRVSTAAYAEDYIRTNNSESSMSSNGSSLSSSPMSAGFSSDSDEVPEIKRPEHPEYAIEVKRLESYTDWPKTMKQKPKDLSDAGFYYTGKGDRVMCFSCGGGLKDWEENDDPWEQHAMWYNNCEYVKLIKGNEYIQQCLDKKNKAAAAATEPAVAVASSSSISSSVNMPSTSKSSAIATCNDIKLGETSTPSNSQPSEEDDENSKKIPEGKLCKICYVNEYNTAFFPCGHVIACAKCASSVTKCPLCRKSFTNVMRVYFS